MNNLPINSIVEGDCQRVMQDWPDGCIDLILTDPPYPMEFDEVWDKLASSYRILKDGGFCATLCGHYQLPRVIDALREGGYGYFWLATANNNNQPIMHGFQVKCCFKPFVVFRKGKARPNRIFYDRFSLRMETREWKNSQALHKWGQSMSLFYEPMDAFSCGNEIILDPFVGSGTVCELAKRMGRRWIGIDIDPNSCKTSIQRITAVDTGVPVKEQRQGQMALFNGSEV
jgi:modification methylase